jgi:hypothetical protein
MFFAEFQKPNLLEILPLLFWGNMWYPLNSDLVVVLRVFRQVHLSESAFASLKDSFIVAFLLRAIKKFL